MPSDQMQKKVDYYYKPYALFGMNTKKHMDFSLNERDEYLL